MPENGNGMTLEDSGEYRQRVRGLERQYDALSTQISNINSKIDERFSSIQQIISQTGKPQWNNIISACAFTFAMLSGLVTLITLPIFSSINDLKTADKEYRIEMATVMGRGRDERTLEIRDLRTTLMQDIRDIREDLVPRKEHLSHQANLTAQLGDLSRRIGEVREDVQGIFNARDIIRKLMDDMGELQKEVRAKNH